MFAAALAALALSFTGHPVDVRCPSLQEWPDPIAAQLGPSTRAYTWFEAGRPTYTTFSPQVCGYLILLAQDPNDRAGSRLNGAGARALEGQAALTFLHELEHQALATRDEGIAECAAVRALPSFFALLHVRRPAPLELAARALHNAKPAAYRTVC